MFLIPHKGTPLIIFDFIYPVILQGSWLSVVSAIALIFVILFAVLHLKLLYWNIIQYNAFKKTKAFDILLNSNAEVTLMALPLTYAMTINVLFIVGAVFVPNLWSVVEYIFPFALLGLVAISYYAINIFMDYFLRLIKTGDFDFTKNNNLSQMISVFAFTMVGVGFAAAGAMSHNIVINAIGLFGAIFFMSIAILLLFIKLFLGIKSMLRHGINDEASPTLWIMIPILTLIGITFVRITFGLVHHFNQPLVWSSLFTFTSTIVSLQLIFGIMGYKMMKMNGYFDNYLYGNTKSVTSFALVCPGVALMVFGMFFINYGLMKNNVFELYSLPYFLMMLPFMYVQYKTVSIFFKLKHRFSL